MYNLLHPIMARAGFSDPKTGRPHPCIIPVPVEPDNLPLPVQRTAESNINELRDLRNAVLRLLEEKCMDFFDIFRILSKSKNHSRNRIACYDNAGFFLANHLDGKPNNNRP